MKRIIALTLAVLVLLSLCACGGNENAGGKDPEKNDGTTAGTEGSGFLPNLDKKETVFAPVEVHSVYEGVNDKDVYFYDEAGNLIKSEYHINGGLRSVTTYNENGDTLQIQFYQDGVEKEGTLRIFTYDDAGRLVKYQDCEDYCLEETEVYTYNLLGFMTSKTVYDEDELDDIFYYTYDINGRLEKEEEHDEDGLERGYRYTYDDAGRMTAKTYFNTSGDNSWYTYAYDDKGNLTREELTYFEHIVTPNGNGFDVQKGPKKTDVTTYENSYDENGRLIKRVCAGHDYPNTCTQTFVYDASGNLVERTVDYAGKNIFKDVLTYDENGNITSAVSIENGTRVYSCTVSYQQVTVGKTMAQSIDKLIFDLDLISEEMPADPENNNW